MDVKKVEKLLGEVGARAGEGIYEGLRECAPKFHHTSIVLYSGRRKRSGSKRRRKRWDGKAVYRRRGRNLHS